jgi:hypothetical protein
MAVEPILRRRPPPQTLRWVIDSLGGDSRIAFMRWLAGGKSHANHAVDVVDGRGYSHRLVLRRWVRPNWSVSDSDFDARREAKILELLSDSVVPAPKLVAVDAEGATCDVPALLMSRLPGRRPEPPEDMRAFLRRHEGVPQLPGNGPPGDPLGGRLGPRGCARISSLERASDTQIAGVVRPTRGVGASH